MIGINVDFSRSELGEVDRVRVLHVDDAPGFLKAASKMLEAQGNFQVDTAQSVKEGLEKLKRESFDAVVADYQMPEQDGLEFLKQLRDQGDQIPFIMFTGKGREEVAMRALNLGADRYLNKHGEPEVVYGELAHSIRRSVERYRVRREMEAREERFRVFLEGFQGIAYQVRVEDTEGEMGNFELLQGKVEEIAGHPAEDFLRKEKTWYKVIHPDDLQFVLQKRQKLLSNPGHMADVEYRILHKNGDIKWVRDISQTSQAGNMLQGTIYDITERKRMEEELRRSKEKYRELINGMGDTAWVIDLEGNFVDVNDTAVEVLGYSREELLSMGPTDIDSSLDPEEIRELIKNMPADEIQVFETTHITKQGEEIPVEVKSSLLTYQGKLAILSIARDITQRKLVEKKLRESEKWYRAVFENTGTAMCIVEEDKTLARVNRRFEEISGYSREEVEGKKWMQFVTPEHLQRMEVYHRERRKKGGEAPKHYSADFVDKEGRIKHGLLTVDLIPGTKRSVVSILDITERKQAEERLLLLSQAVNASTDSIALSDMEGRIIDVNEATLEIYGTEDREDLVGKNVFQLIAPEHREKAVEAMEEALKKGYIEHQEVNIKTKDGGKLPVEMNVSLMKNKEGEPTGFVGISRDITERIQREQQLRGEREILEKVTQNVGAGLTIISKDYRVIWANQLLRQSSEQVIGEYCYQVYNQRDSVCPRCGVKEIFETGKDYVVHEQKVKGPDGHPMWVKITATPLRDKEGNITAALELSTFHTEQKRMEEELRRSKEKYRKQFEGSLDGIVLADAETGEIIDCNQAAAELVGREKEELMGKPQTILHPPQEVEGGFSKTFLQHLQKKEDEVLESQVITKTGEIKDVAIKATHFELEGRTILQGVFRDITEQKRKKKALERYRKVVERTEDLVAAVDADYKYILVNDAFLEYHQLKREQVVGKTVKEVLGEDLFQEVIKPRIDRCLAGETVEYEMKHIHPELGERYFEVNYYSLRNEYTADPVVVSNIRDITQRKQAEENLQESERRLNTFLDSSSDMAFLKDKSFRYLLVNDAYLDFLGIDSKEEVMGKTDFELLPQKLAEQCRESDQKVLREGKPVNEVEEGMDSIFESRKFPVYLADGSVGIGGLIRDITEQKRAVEALQAAEKKYRESIENANVGIIVYDSEGEVRMVNPRMEQMIGYQREEIPTLKEWFQKLYPTEEERRKIRSIWFQRMNEEGEVRGGDAVITTKQSEKRHFLFNGVQLESGDSLAFARDITQQKKMEEEIKKKSEELRRLNEKLEIVGKIARHDVRNKLSTVATNLYLAKKQLGDQHEVVDYLEDIKTAVDQTNEILDFAKAYEQLGTQELEPMDVGQVVEDATQQFSNLKGIEVVNECWGLKVRADQTLSHIFYNLIHNSLQHGGEEVSRVRVYCQETGENQVKVVYEDDGEGIPVEEKEKVFQEGYGAGTGYGLYLIREMCKVYGWTIKECGQQGEGARFTITIPQ